jgi:hypothetical protein
LENKLLKREFLSKRVEIGGARSTLTENEKYKAFLGNFK